MATKYVSFSGSCEARADAWQAADGYKLHLYMGYDGKDGCIAVDMTPEAAKRLLVHLNAAMNGERGVE